MLISQEKWRLLHDKSNYLNYENGKFISKKYSKEELEEKRQYFESKIPENVPNKRWMYEIKRVFELDKYFDDYPDCGLSRLEFILETGNL